jgi:hypothetical protein
MSRFVLTHDSDFGTLAVHRNESITGILYLGSRSRPPAEVMANIQALMDVEIDLDTTGRYRVPCRTSEAPEAIRRDVIGIRDHPSTRSLTSALH